MICFLNFRSLQSDSQLQPFSGSYPDDPGVHGPKHGTLAKHRLAHFIHVVQQPAELHCAEVGADGKARFVLEREQQKHRLERISQTSILK